MVASGRSCTEVSQLFGEDATTVQRWVRRFEHHGFAGLRDGERPDGPSCWTGDSGRVCRVTCAAIRIAVVVHSTSGTVRCWPST